jgi:hypothetical protein
MAASVRPLRVWMMVGLCWAGLGVLPRVARGCSRGPLPPTRAFPASGAVEVSPQSSIFVSSTTPIPAGLALEANGQAVAIAGLDPLGPGPRGESWLRVRADLSPTTTYIVRGQDNGIPRELTRFTTSAGYDKQPGTPPELGRLRLWRIRYAASEVGGGSCVASELEGYIDLEYEPGAVPGTPAAELVNVLVLSAKSGGEAQSLVFTGSERIHLVEGEPTPDPMIVEVPTGGRPYPPSAQWKPILSPDREYCATLTLYGRNDLAAPAIRSNTVCAPVISLASGSSAAGSGCSVGRRGGGGLLFVVAATVVLVALRRWRSRASGPT